MIKKGIILAAGNGTRLKPLTNFTNKHFLNLYDKPVIFYSLSTLMLANIRNILIVTNKKDLDVLQTFFGNGKRLGLNISYAIQKLNTGIFTDGDLKRLMQKKKDLKKIKIKSYMTRKPYIVEENVLASEILAQMNKRKITNVCVYKKNEKRKIVGVIHIHNLLKILK